MCERAVFLINQTIYNMNKYSILSLSALLMLMTTLSSCELIGGIFKAGVWAGVLMVVVVVGLVIFLLAKLFGGGR